MAESPGGMKNHQHFNSTAAPNQSLWKWSKVTGSVRDPAYQFLRLSFGRLEIDDLREVGMCGGIKVKIAVRC